MPRSRDRAAFQERYPDERWVGACSTTVAELLVRYDHHVVRIGGRRALLLTYHWAATSLDEHAEPHGFQVSFTYPRGHPAAPRDVQAVVDTITFRPATGEERSGA